MSLREPKRPCREINQVLRNSNTTPLVNSQEKGYCSCSPFECICSYQTNLPPQMSHFPQSPQSYQPATSQLDGYWGQEPMHAQAYPTDTISVENTQCDFNISTDLFQPEEIFQLDQPIKPDFMHIQGGPTDSRMNTNELARSPPTLLDLGSGTIHKEFKTEDYWSSTTMNFLNDDSNASSNSRFNINPSPDIPKIINNNCLGVVPHNYYVNTPKEETTNNNYGLHQKQSNFFDLTVTTDTTEFKPELSFDSKMFSYFGDTETHHNIPNVQSTSKNTKQGFSEYIDLSQYSDYSNFLNVYENKVNHSDACGVFNELDFRISAFGENVVDYNSHAFDTVTNQ